MAAPTQEMQSPAVPIRLTYAQIARDLEERIDRGEYAPGSRLPSYRELAELYSVGITTAQAAYRELKARGVVVGAGGRGMFVRD